MNIFFNVVLIIIAVLLFCLIITVHEFGHFIMAKLFKVRVNEFSIGMGPVLFKRKKKETVYSLRAFPIGGFCAMEGEDEESSDENAFGNKKVWQRILIVSMGAIFNIVLGLILMLILTTQQASFTDMTVAEFSNNASTQMSGLQVGDKILSLNGYRIYTDRDFVFAVSYDSDISNAIANNDECFVDMVVKRGNEKIFLDNVKFDISDNGYGNRSIVLDFKINSIEKNLLNTLSESFKYTVSSIKMVWASLVGLLMGRFGINEMSGPVGVATVIGQSMTQGLSVSFTAALLNIIYIMVIITVNLGIFNLLPVPALDGGRLVFLFIEGIIRKPIPAKYESWVNSLGFIILMLFMVFITYNDILRLVTGKGFGG